VRNSITASAAPSLPTPIFSFHVVNGLRASGWEVESGLFIWTCDSCVTHYYPKQEHTYTHRYWTHASTFPRDWLIALQLDMTGQLVILLFLLLLASTSPEMCWASFSLFPCSSSVPPGSRSKYSIGLCLVCIEFQRRMLPLCARRKTKEDKQDK
jgi:hypothetical protein